MITVKNLSVRLGAFSIERVNLSVRRGEYFVLLGPTGAGKTVLIESVAGLHRINEGGIWMDSAEVTRWPPEKRMVGYVPQDYALFPFLDVRGNILFGLKKKGAQRGGMEEKVGVLSRLLGISTLLERKVDTLSGGEKQRVALARALAPSPRILLLDEPMASLDVKTAKYLRLELKRIHQELGITTIHVTHNLAEAEELADRMAIMNSGTIEQVGTPREVLFHPESEVVADFLGKPNILNCDACVSLGYGLVGALCGKMSIVLPQRRSKIQKIALFPHDIYVSKNRPPGPDLNRFRGVVTEIRPFSTLMRLHVQVGEQSLLAELPREVFEDLDIVVGNEVYLILKLRSLKVY
jgi:ABC-type sugar transport system ATPase subunit